jgi:hypothetical protein
MKPQIIAVCSAVLIATATWLNATEPGQPNHPASAEFEKLKSLVGTWKGTTDMGQGPVEMTVQYRLLAGGSVLEERVFQGTPNEMVTMYYEKNGKLGLTHYCVMGNRPAMLLTTANSKTLTFDLDPSCGIDTAKESHMHAMTLTFNDPETITASCKAFIDGKQMPEHPTTLKRIASN